MFLCFLNAHTYMFAKSYVLAHDFIVFRNRLSRPMRARGLKLAAEQSLRPVEYMSRPMRARGLKLINSTAWPITSSRAPCGRVD